MHGTVSFFLRITATRCDTVEIVGSLAASALSEVFHELSVRYARARAGASDDSTVSRRVA